MFEIEEGSNKSLFTLIAVVVFGIFLSLSYFLFQDNMKGILANVMDGVKSGTLVTMGGTFGEPPVLIPNAESDFVFTASTGKITGYIGTRFDVVIPETINGVPVKIIGYNSFKSKMLTSVYIPDGVISIDQSAFEVNSLTFIDLPNNLTYIGSSAFAKNKLMSLVIPNSVTSIAVSAFNTNELTSVELSTSLTSISDAVFYNNKLTSVTIPNSVKTIGSHAFNNNLITHLDIPTSVTSISIYAFYTNPITSVKVPTATTLGYFVFPNGTIITRY